MTDRSQPAESADGVPADTQPTSESLEQACQLFRKVVDPQLLETWQPSAPQAVYTTWVTVWLLIYQRLHGNASLQAAVIALLEFVGQISTNKRVTEGTLSNNTGSFSRARTRLEVDTTQAAADHVCTSLLPPPSPLCGGRHILIMDGSTLSLSASAAVRRQWPGIHNQHGPSPWPIAHVTVAHELETGLAWRPEVGAMYGPDAVSEVALAIQLLPRIPANSVLLADRGFGIFGFVHAAVQAGHDTLTRLTESRFRALARRARVLRPGVWGLTWQPSRKDCQTFHELPAEAHVTIELHEFPGHDGQPIWVATTLELTTPQVAAIYARRYEVEWDIRQWKRQLEMGNTRGQSVAMVLKEVALATIAYNLVVQVRILASAASRLPAKRLSFARIRCLVETLLLESQRQHSAAEWLTKFDQVLKYAAKCKVPNRPGRSYPRVAYGTRTSKYPRRGRPPEDTDPK